MPSLENPTSRTTLTLFLALGLAAACAAAPAPARLQVGAATSNITPPLGTLRVGSFAPFPIAHVNDELHARCFVLDIAWRPIEPELPAWAKDVEAKAPRLSSGNLPVGAKWPTTPDWVTRLSYAGRLQGLANNKGPAKVPLPVMRIGDIRIGTSPCEAYAEIGLEFKQRSPFAKSFMVQLNHDMIGHLPTPPQLEFEEYSTWPGTNVLERQASVKMLDHLAEMAGELKQTSR